MPMPPSHYPPGWNAFSYHIRVYRARNQCECTGQCGLHQPKPLPRRCTETNHRPARWARGRVILTVAHLCHCSPICLIPSHVKAMCQRCHLRFDRFTHARHRLDRQRNDTLALPVEEWFTLNPNNQPEQNETGRRIARHAASHCADTLDFASATLIAHAWGFPYFGTFLTGCPNGLCWHNAPQ